MCSVIEYGFTINGSMKSTSLCNATTSDTLGANVGVSTDASDVGKTLKTQIKLYFNGVLKDTYNSDQYTPTYSPSLHIFVIPFTGLTLQPGTYTIGYGGYDECVFITSPSYVVYCSLCSSADCVNVIVTTPCTVPGCGFNIT